jgi:hypothetical protein
MKSGQLWGSIHFTHIVREMYENEYCHKQYLIRISTAFPGLEHVDRQQQNRKTSVVLDTPTTVVRTFWSWCLQVNMVAIFKIKRYQIVTIILSNFMNCTNGSAYSYHIKLGANGIMCIL